MSRSALLAASLLVVALSVVALVSNRNAAIAPVEASARIIPTNAPEPQTQAGQLREGRPLDLNRATTDELRLLPGIGAKLAGRIVEERRRRGQFSSLQELDAVPGIGPRKLVQLAPLITFQSASQSGSNQPTDSVNAK